MKNILSVDDIVFGNPCKRDNDLIAKEVYLDKLLPRMKELVPPSNSSSVVMKEMEMLKVYLSAGKAKKSNLFDENLLTVIKDVFASGGANPEFLDTVCNGIAEDVVPVITKLKYYHNRPRPAQLAYYLGIELYPEFSYFVTNPSYPSGHTTLTAVTCHVLGNIFPESYKKVESILSEARQSRLCLGVHYPSDNDIAMVLAKEILNNTEFKTNYKL